MQSFHDKAEASNKVVKFTHVATGARVQFPAFLTDFSDTYSVNWGSEDVYGRMDPIKTYQNTKRSISIGFDVLAFSRDKARENMSNYGKLIQMLYPVYGPAVKAAGRDTRTLKAPPYMRLEFANLITNNSRNANNPGLLGCINGLNFTPNRDAGFFHDTDSDILLPKVFSVSFTFEPQHESTLGWDGDEFMTRQFPYNQLQLGTDDYPSPVTTNDDVARARQNIVLNDDGD